jgi:hypothetical protein
MKFIGRISLQLCSKRLGEKEILAVLILLTDIFSDHIKSAQSIFLADKAS